MKRFISLFSAVTLATGLLSTPVLAQGTQQSSVSVTIQFTDIGSVPWAKDAITRLTSEGVIAGMGGNKFAPYNGVTREQFAKLLNYNYGLDTVVKPIKYIDVTTKRWSYTSIQNATPYMDYYKNVTGTGYLFRPEQEMQRQDVAVTLVKLMMTLGLADLPTTEETNAILAPYKDANKIALTARPYLAEAIDTELLYGYGDNILAPTEKVNRAQAAVLLDRIDQHLLVVPDLPAEGDTVPTDSVEDDQPTTEPTDSTEPAEPAPIPTTPAPIPTVPTTPPATNTPPSYIDRAIMKPDLETPAPVQVAYKWAGYIGCTGSNVTVAGSYAVAVSGCSDGEVYAYDILTGKKMWGHRQDRYYQGMVAGSPTALLFTQGDGVQALSTSSGKPIWSQYFNGKVREIKFGLGQAYVITANALYAMDETNGFIVWGQSFPSGVTQLEVSEDQVAVGTPNGRVYSFDYNGEQLMSVALSNSGVTGVNTDGTHWLITHGNRVSAVDFDGNVEWTRAFYNGITGGDIAVDGDTVYAVTTNRLIVAIELSTGEVLGVNPLNYTIAHAPVAQDGRVYMTTNDGYLHIVDGASLMPINTTSSASSVYMNRLYINGTPLLYAGYIIGLHHMPGYSGDTDIIAFR